MFASMYMYTVLFKSVYCCCFYIIARLVLKKLKDIFIQHWHSDIERTSNTNLYKHFKTSFGISNYINILDKRSCKRLIAFLIRNHILPIEIGRWQNIPSHDRKCIFAMIRVTSIITLLNVMF